MNYKGIYKRDGGREEVVLISSNRDEVVKALVNRVDGNYCLDTKEDRLNALAVRNFCMLGCGPSELVIEEVEA